MTHALIAICLVFAVLGLAAYHWRPAVGFTIASVAWILYFALLLAGHP